MKYQKCCRPEICMQPLCFSCNWRLVFASHAHAQETSKKEARESFEGRHALLGRKAKCSLLFLCFFCSLVHEGKTRTWKRHVEHVNGTKESEAERAIYLLFWVNVEKNLTTQYSVSDQIHKHMFLEKSKKMYVILLKIYNIY